LTAQHRRDLAALKRQVALLLRTVSFLETQEKRRVAEQPTPVPEEMTGRRFRAGGVKSHRQKLGLSASDYGRLVGVSELSVYHWESGKSRPRPEQLAKLAAVRGLGKREAIKRLELLGGAQKQPGARSRRRSGGPSAEDFVLALVKSRKATTTAAINATWRGAGRPGKADNTLSRMVKTGRLKREKLKGERGSQYRVA
jgi:DNA-binding transcriptional regulator YiaG